jgi:ATP-dependent Zn protease
LPPKTHFSIWYFLIAFLLFTYLQQYFLSRKVETIPYRQFKQALAEGNVSKLTIGPENITGTLTGREKKPGQQFTTILPFVLAAIGEAAGSVGDPCPAHLFIIERNKNANIVVYDANRGPAGMVLSVPLTSLVKIGLESSGETWGLAIMLGSDTEK